MAEGVLHKVAEKAGADLPLCFSRLTVILLSSNHLSHPVGVIEGHTAFQSQSMRSVPVVLVHESGFNIAQKIKLSIRAGAVFSRGRAEK